MATTAEGMLTQKTEAQLKKLSRMPPRPARHRTRCRLPDDASVAHHRKLGFTEVGTFHEYALKNGQYLSSVWMECRFPCHEVS
jgi:L-amino acid N-acyltransferase YncA